MWIDAHHHLWKYSESEYPWITTEMTVLRHDYLLPDLFAAMTGSAVGGTVVVQARQTVEETFWLLELAERTDRVRGVVGWAPLCEDSLDWQLEILRARPKLKGIRHIIHDEPDDLFILRQDFNRGVGRLKTCGLAYDILIFERHLSQAIRFVDRHPDQVFVVDHIAKPRIREGVLEPWRGLVRELARRPNVYCKVSGLVTEADWCSWTPQQLTPYLDVVLEAFGPARLMFGSDWPVMLVAGSYDRWLATVLEWSRTLSEDERASLMGGTAREVYRL